MGILRLALLGFLGVIFVASHASGASGETAVDAADLFELAVPDNPQVSPDGLHVLYSRSMADILTDRMSNALWVADIGTESRISTRLVVSASQHPSAAQWSPDGKAIAYLASLGSTTQIHVMDIAEGVGRPITNLKTPPARLFWSPDAKSIAFTALVESAPLTIPGLPRKPEGANWAPPARIEDRLHYREDGAYPAGGSGSLARGQHHVFIVPAVGGAVRQLTQDEEADVSDGNPLSWTPDSRNIVFASSGQPEPDLPNNDLYMISVAGGSLRKLTSGPSDKSEPAVSPDGRLLAYVGTPDKPTFYVQPHLWVMPLQGGAARDITQKLDRAVEKPVWSEDSHTIHFVYYDQGQARVAHISAVGGEVAVDVPETSGPRLMWPYSRAAYSIGSQTIAYLAPHQDSPPSLTISRSGKAIGGIDLNSEWRKDKKVGRIEELHFKSSADGHDIEGWLQYPPAFDPTRKYPLILEIHGGPNQDYGPRFAMPYQLYAAAGYIVLFTNPRGSKGYGEAFADAIDGAFPDGLAYADLMSAVDATVEKSFIDRDNLFVTGGSAGGALTGWIVGKTDRFKAAVIQRPALDWTVEALTSDGGDYISKYWMGGMPWDQHDAYWRRSPLSLVGNVKTPTALICGETDFRTTIGQVEAYFAALKMRGIDAEMVRLPEAGHEFGRPSQQLLTILAVIDWFDRHRAHRNSPRRAKAAVKEAVH